MFEPARPWQRFCCEACRAVIHSSGMVYIPIARRQECRPDALRNALRIDRLDRAVDGPIFAEDRLLSSRDLAQLLNVSPFTIRGWRGKNLRTGLGPPFFRINGRPRYSLAMVRQWLAEQVVVVGRAEREVG